MKISLRESTPLDIAFVYQLRNEIDTRKFMLREDTMKRRYISDPNPVSAEQIQSMNPLILTLDDKPIGYGTITEKGNKALLTWNVALPFRNRGHGRKLIARMLEMVGDKTPLAMIKNDDIASQRAARAAGMVDQTERETGKNYPVETWGVDRGPTTGV